MSVTPDGYTPRTEDQYLALIRSAYETESGELPQWAEDVFLANITQIAAEEFAGIEDAAKDVFDSLDLDDAEDRLLDDLGSLLGVDRDPATSSQVTLALTGTANLVIPTARIVEGGGTDGRARWVTSEAVPLDGAGAGAVVAVAEEPGAIAAGPGVITKIVTPLSGWASVTNPAAASEGTPLEANATYRARIRRSRQVSGSGSPNAIRSRLEDLDFITAARVINNNDGIIQVIDGVLMAPRSVRVVLWPSTLTAAQGETVADLLARHIPAGTRSTGADAVATATRADGSQRAVAWDYATETPVTVSVTVTSYAPGFALADVEDEIEEQVQALFTALNVGDVLRILRARGATAVDGVLEATVLLNGAPADIDPGGLGIATLLVVVVT